MTIWIALFEFALIIAVGAVAYLIFRNYGDGLAFGGTLFVVVASLVAVFGFFRPVEIAPSETALVIGPHGIQGPPVTGRLLFLKGWEHVERFSHNPEIFSQRGAEGTGITVTTKENMQASVDISVQYNVDFTHLPEYYQRYGGTKNLHAYLQPIVRNVVREVLGHYEAGNLSDKKDEIQAKIGELIIQRARSALPYVIIEDVALRNIALPEAVQQAAEEVAVQDMRNQQSALAVEEAMNNAEKARQEAQGQADAGVIQAEADAKRQKIGAEAQAARTLTLAEAQAQALAMLADAQQRYNESIQGMCAPQMTGEQCAEVIMAYYNYLSVQAKWSALAGKVDVNYNIIEGLDGENGINLFNMPSSLFQQTPKPVLPPLEPQGGEDSNP